jgi:LruC domain-containing protein
MKRLGVSALSVILVGLISGCFFEFSAGPGGTADPVNRFLPPDIIDDEPRVTEGDFQFETLLPVTFRLKVDDYDLRALDPSLSVSQARSVLAERRAVAAEPVSVIMTLTTLEKKTVYQGRLESGETGEFNVLLPSAEEDLFLTLAADGFEPRSVVVEKAVRYAVIDREMPIGKTELSVVQNRLADSDLDSVPDDFDAFPFDPERAFIIKTPAEEPMTVAYEDLYPVPGDSDYNDFNVSYWITEIQAAGGGRKEIQGTAKARARAAGYNHLFGVRIYLGPNVGGNAIVRYYNEIGDLIAEESSEVIETAELVLFGETKKAFKRPTDTVTIDNGYPDRLDSKGFSTEFTIVLNDPVVADPSWSPFALPPYDPFLYVHNSQRDIHLIGMPKLEGSLNKDTDPPNFEVPEGPFAHFPWTMLLPIDWPYPIERVDIHDAYPEFEGWYASEGSLNTDWYLNPVADLVITPEGPPPPPTTYDRIYIETYDTQFGFRISRDTQLWLYDDIGQFINSSSDGGGGVFDSLHTAGLTSGIYYIKVAAGPNFVGTNQDYTLRVVSLAAGDAPPPPQTQVPPATDALEPDGTPEPWNGGSSVAIALDDVVPRKLTDGGDADWFALTLP